MRADKIISVLEQLTKSSYKSVLINGEWGIGKTKYAEDFVKQRPNSCYISLFGKKDINSIMQDIYYKLIENDNMGKLKKYLMEFSEKLKDVNISFSGLSLTIPLLKDIFSSVSKELNQKDTYIIIFDDLERKHKELGIKEIFGLTNSLSNINGIKTVLIASRDNFDEETQKVFDDYNEKAIDHTYMITKYADNAPLEIMGEEEWETLKSIAEFLTFKNLRTFQKAKLFISEVIDTLGKDVFTDKFTKSDVYRMCFATVFYNVEHKGEMKLLNSEMRKSKDDLTDAGIVDYMYVYILKNSLDNTMSKSVLFHIKKWFETGEYSREDIIKDIDLINNFKYKPNNFYSSDKDIIGFISEAKNYIRELKGNEELPEICSVLSNGISWSEVLDIDFEIDKNEILSSVKRNIVNHIDIEKSIYENELSLSHFILESEKAKDIVKSINKILKFEYYNKLTEKIKDCFKNKSYDNHYLNNLWNSIVPINEQCIKDCVKQKLEDNEFFFPIPAGQITQSHWDWCLLIKNLILSIEKEWSIRELYENFQQYVEKCLNDKSDRILQHRLKTLFRDL
ncbi:P-loop NTPase family protein [Bacillus haynesii]|uniref:hypothetical protein n=1 Tax=Bacillus haynesii TaxID=1925021 RepID=UPI00228079C5|nr:hypothetical protein [Bacillus haynesii]MCY9263990.1 KAP family NTPase [Bacillus haynesii]MEC1531478.1 hypothetical protein [Bacillus haynesii]